jgi:hypothetical protein
MLRSLPRFDYHSLTPTSPAVSVGIAQLVHNPLSCERQKPGPRVPTCSAAVMVNAQPADKSNE